MVVFNSIVLKHFSSKYSIYKHGSVCKQKVNISVVYWDADSCSSVYPKALIGPHLCKHWSNSHTIQVNHLIRMKRYISNYSQLDFFLRVNTYLTTDKSFEEIIHISYCDTNSTVVFIENEVFCFE